MALRLSQFRRSRWELPPGRFARVRTGFRRSPLLPLHGRGPSASNGFTLVELLVVLAVITVLVAVLTPVLWWGRNRARNTACASHLRQLGATTLMYTADWDDILPQAPGTPYADSLANTPYLQSYQEVRSAARPTQSTYLRGILTRYDRSLTPPLFQCPNDVGAKGTGPEAWGFKSGSVYDSALTSYMWDPSSVLTEDDLEGGKAAQRVNGASLSEIRDPAYARLLQDYGALWHTTLSAGQTRGADRLKQGLVNVVFVDGHIAQKTNTAVQSVTASLAASPPSGSAP